MPNTIKAETAHVLEKIAVHCKDEDDPAEAAFNLIQQAPLKVFKDLGVDKFDPNYRKTQSHTGKFYKSLLNMKNWTVDVVREHIQMLAAAAAAQSPDGAPDLPVPDELLLLEVPLLLSVILPSAPRLLKIVRWIHFFPI
eukprot:scaffold6119_cov115-Skeletonema_menzelii.AAC.4